LCSGLGCSWRTRRERTEVVVQWPRWHGWHPLLRRRLDVSSLERTALLTLQFWLEFLRERGRDQQVACAVEETKVHTEFARQLSLWLNRFKLLPSKRKLLPTFIDCAACTERPGARVFCCAVHDSDKGGREGRENGFGRGAGGLGNLRSVLIRFGRPFAFLGLGRAP